MQDRHVTYREIEQSFGNSPTNIHSILQTDLFSLDQDQFDNFSKERFVSIGVKKCWKNAVPQNTFIRSSQLTNHGSVRMSPKQNNTPLFKPVLNAMEAVCGKITTKRMVSCLFYKTGYL